MKLLSEMVVGSKSYMTEDVNKEKQFWVEGTTIEYDVENRNGRFYSKRIINEALENYFKGHTLGQNCYGVLDHPQDGAGDSDYVNPKEVSHIFHELTEIEGGYSTKCKVMDTPNGMIVRSFIKENAVLGISTRGFGDAVPSKKGYNEVVSYDFITLGDIVTDPSAPNAYLRGIMEKSEWIYENGIYKKVGAKVEKHMDKAHKHLSKTQSKDLMKESIKCFNDYMNILLKRRIK